MIFSAAKPLYGEKKNDRNKDKPTSKYDHPI